MERTNTTCEWPHPNGLECDECDYCFDTLCKRQLETIEFEGAAIETKACHRCHEILRRFIDYYGIFKSPVNSSL